MRVKILILFLVILGCVEPFTFEPLKTEKTLVVDASLTNIPGKHYANISYSNELGSEQTEPITSAQVWIEDHESNRVDLIEELPGRYFTDSLFAGIVGKSYTLYIETSDALEFHSTAEILNPPVLIDSIYGRFQILPSDKTHRVFNGIQFYVDAHSQSNSELFFRYDYEETWEIKVPFASWFEYDTANQRFTGRLRSVETCYKSAKSIGIIQGNTTGLTDNRLAEMPIRFVPEIEPQLLHRYSLIVKQRSLSRSSYMFFKNLRENNESVGTLFDRQKGLIKGNINPVNSEMPVLGLFEVAGVSESLRIFENQEFASSQFSPERQFCHFYEGDTTEIPPLLYIHLQGYNAVLYSPLEDGLNVFVSRQCGDCTIFGVLDPPDFWEE